MSKLVIKGGEKACPNTIPKWPHYEEDEVLEVVRVLQSGNVNQWTGEDVKQFEAACSQKFSQPYAVAVFNGTLALELILRSFGIGKGDEVIVTPRSFIASVSAVVMVGATPVFADVDILSQNISPNSIEAVISERTRAIIPVHLNGWPCDMSNIMRLAKKYNLIVIEDCAQAHGAMIDDKPIGSFGDGAAFSFCQDKIISTGGEGGMALFKDKKIWHKAWSYKDHGKDYESVFHQQHPPGIRLVHESFGTNWRMTNMQAAIGVKQLEKLDKWHDRRNEIAQELANCLTEFTSVFIPLPDENIKHAYYRFSFHIDKNKLKPDWDRKRIMTSINAEGVACLEICPQIYKEKAFEGLNFPKPNCPNAVRLGGEVLQIPIHHLIDNATLKLIFLALIKVLKEATI